MALRIFTNSIRSNILHNFSDWQFADIQKHNFKRVTAPVSIDDDISSRADKLAKLIKKQLHNNRTQNYHLISYSCSGIDARYLITKNLIPKPINFITINTPNRGSRLADLFVNGVFDQRKQQQISKIMGFYPHQFQQFSRTAISEFNKKHSYLETLSIGSQCIPTQCHVSLSDTADYLQSYIGQFIKKDNNGLFCHDQFHLEATLVNMSGDHFSSIDFQIQSGKKTLKLINQLTA